MEIFKLFGSILVDSSKAEESISKTEKKADGLGSKLGKGIKTAGKWALGLGAAAGAVGGAMFGMASKAADATDRIDKMSQKMGMSREGFQEWDFILSQNGASIDSMKGGMKTLTNQVDELSKGGKVATDAFGQLGLSYEDMAGLTQEEIFEKTVVTLQGVEDETKRAALASDLLGKSGQELGPLLNAGADSVNAMKKEAKDLGLVMGDDAVDAGVKFTDSMDKLKRSFGAVFTKLGSAVMPAFINFADWITSHMPEIQAVMSVVFGTIKTVTQKAYEVFNEYLLPVFQMLFAWVQENMPTIKKVMHTVFDAVEKIVSKCWKIFSQNFIPILVALWDFISPTFPLIQGVVEVTFGAIVTAVEFVVDVFDRVTGAIKTAIEWLGSWNDEDVEDKEPNTTRGGKKPTVNGKHATGLAYVPFNGYVAELHEGERVLTKQENTNLSSNSGDVIITGNQFIIREESDIKKVSRQLQKDIRGKQRGTAALA